MPTRHERIKQEEEQRAQAQRRRYVLIGLGIVGGVILVVALIVGVGVLSPTPTPTAVAQARQAQCIPVQTLPSQGGEHIDPSQSHPPYNSNPPTSGWHWANSQERGIYTTQQVQEQLVHNLEHGGIMIQYRDLAQADVQRLTDLVRSDRPHLILAPYPGLSEGAKVALTAWSNLQLCTGVDENAIRAFIRAYRDKGPELVP